MLTIIDGAGGDFGVLNGWTLEICRTLNTNCPNALAVNGTIASSTYQAAMDLTSNGMVQNGAVVPLNAGNSITLEANFEVQQGSVLEALIEGCATFAIPPGAEKKQ